MATKNIEMYSRKQYELEEIKDRIIAYFDRTKQDPIALKQEIGHLCGSGKTLLLVFEKAFTHIVLLPRPTTHRYTVCLVIQLTEFDEKQYAHIIASGGMDAFLPHHSETLVADDGALALRSIGFAASEI